MTRPRDPAAVRDLLVRPRRSRDLTSARPRNLARTQARMYGYAREARYAPVGRTLFTPSVWNFHTFDRANRGRRAEDALALADADLDDAVLALQSITLGHTPETLRSVDAHERACRTRYAVAAAELADAQRSAAHPAGELVTPPRVSLPEPRTWPNAAPGGTSLHRRTCMKGHVALADNGYYPYPGGYAGAMYQWGTFTAADGRQPWAPVRTEPQFI